MMSDSSGPADPPGVDYGASAPTHQQMMHDMAHREFMASDPSVARPWDGRRTILSGYVLWLFLGWIGGHRLYVGRWKSALGMAAAGFATWVLTESLGPWPGLPMTIWWIVDALLIPGWIRQVNEARPATPTIVETV